MATATTRTTAQAKALDAVERSLDEVAALLTEKEALRFRALFAKADAKHRALPFDPYR